MNILTDADVYKIKELVLAVNEATGEGTDKVIDFVNSSETPEIRHARKSILFSYLYGKEV